MTGGRRDSVKSFGFSVLGRPSLVPLVLTWVLLFLGTH